LPKLKRRHKSSLNVMNADIEKFVRFNNSGFGKKVMKKEVEYVLNELRNSAKILDVGCGIGVFEQNLPSLNIIGLDVCGELLTEAKKRSGKAFVQGNAEKLQFKDATFDAVFTVTTLEFLDDYGKAVREMARVTKPKGKILVMMLNPESEYFREEMETPEAYYKRIKHVDPREVKDHLSRFYTITKEEKFLGIKGKRVFDTDETRYAGLHVVAGIRK
jgi:ubiquinone/menaquinone biosynthesis C-methylase UbiE